MFRIVITEIIPAGDKPGEIAVERVVERFAQTVDAVDVSKVIAAINFKPRVRRANKPKAVTP